MQNRFCDYAQNDESGHYPVIPRVVAESRKPPFMLTSASIPGTAENMMLADNSVDFITVAQAFHWFDRNIFKAECGRILRTGGKVILVWNSRDATSELVSENDAINKKYCPNFKGPADGTRGAETDDYYSDFFTDEYETKTFRNDLSFDEEGLIGRNLSASYALKKCLAEASTCHHCRPNPSPLGSVGF